MKTHKATWLGFLALTKKAFSAGLFQSEFGLNGNELTYEDDCNENISDPGYGELKLLRYSYNKFNQNCEIFEYHGMGGSPRNNFQMESVCLVCKRLHRNWNEENGYSMEGFEQPRVEESAEDSVDEDEVESQEQGQNVQEAEINPEYNFAQRSALSSQASTIQMSPVPSLDRTNIWKLNQAICGKNFEMYRDKEAPPTACNAYHFRAFYDLAEERCKLLFFSGCFKKPVWGTEDHLDDRGKNIFLNKMACSQRCKGYTLEDREKFLASMGEALENQNQNQAQNAQGDQNQPRTYEQDKEIENDWAEFWNAGQTC